jgi:hypothetical protein
MDRSQYDTKEGIAPFLTSLEGLNQIVAARHEAGYEHSEHLNEFVLLGRFRTDSCGNMDCFRPDAMPPEAYKEVPPVLTKEEFHVFQKPRLLPTASWQVGSSNLPTATAVCPVCGKGWDITNCHLVEMNDVPLERFSLDEFIGKTLGEVITTIEQKPEATYAVFSPSHVFNEKNVDPTFDDEATYDITSEERARRMGWRGEKDGVDANYVIEAGDAIDVSIKKFYHPACFEQQQRGEQDAQLEEQRQAFVEMFTQLGLTNVEIKRGTTPEAMLAEFTSRPGDEELPQDSEEEKEEMRQDMLSCPWLDVTTDQGSFGIGIFGENIPWMYLKGTGITTQDIMGAMGEEVDPRHPANLLPVISEEVMRSFCFLLKRNHKKPSV